MMETIYMSDCCGAELTARVGDEGTGHYECSKCEKPCNQIPKNLTIHVHEDIKVKAHMV